jgi:hypothetical protein
VGGMMKSVFRIDDWSMINPNYKPLVNALWTARYDLKRLTQDEAYLICQAAEDYCHLASHPASTKSIIKQLRKVRQAVKADCCEVE